MSFEQVKGTLSKSVQGFDRFVLFSDNLKSQESEEFKPAIASLNGVAWFRLKHATNLWQVVDADLAQMLKVLIGKRIEIGWTNREMQTDGMLSKSHLQHRNGEFSLPTGLAKHGRSCVHPIMIISESGAGRKRVA